MFQFLQIAKFYLIQRLSSLEWRIVSRDGVRVSQEPFLGKLILSLAYFFHLHDRVAHLLCPGVHDLADVQTFVLRPNFLQAVPQILSDCVRVFELLQEI